MLPNLKDKLNAIPTPEQAYRDMFGLSGQKITRLKVVDLGFHPQRTRMYDEEALAAFAEDIRENGVLEPILVRPMQMDSLHPYNWYQVLNGRNRVAATRLAGVEDIPAFIMENVDDDEAARIVATTTLNQRTQLLPSERAFAYKMLMDANRRQGRRTDLLHTVQEDTLPAEGADLAHTMHQDTEPGTEESANLLHTVRGVSTAAQAAAVHNESARTVHYLLRLTELTEPLLNMVDQGTLPIRAGVHLSYLPQEAQAIVEAYITQHSRRLTLALAEELRKYYESFGEITPQVLESCFSPAAARPVREIKIKYARLQSYIPEDTEDITQYILDALAAYSGTKKI